FEDSALSAGRRCGACARRDVDTHLHIAHAFDFSHRRFGILRDLRTGVRVLGLKADRECDVAAVDANIVNESERNDVARKAGKLDLLQRVKDLFLTGHSISPPESARTKRE